MGISVSSTRTHERLSQKRAVRKMKRYQQNDPTRNNGLPIGNYMQNQMKQTNAHQTNKLNEINSVDNLEINLKTNGKKYGDYQKMSSPRDQAPEMLAKKDQIRIGTPSQFNHPLTIKHNKLVENQVSGQSSLQEIDLTPNKGGVNQLQINPVNTTSFQTINSNKQVLSTSQRNISKTNQSHVNEENEEIEKSIEKKKIEQTKKYIESSQYPQRGNLSNAIYQQKSGTKIETILSDGNNSPNKAVKTVENKQIPHVSAIKLKTDEDYIDEVKPNQKTQKPPGPLLKNNSGKIVGNSSFSTLKKKSMN